MPAMPDGVALLKKRPKQCVEDMQEAHMTRQQRATKCPGSGKKSGASLAGAFMAGAEAP